MHESIALHLAFFAICLVLTVLPFVPAFNEWRRPTDVAALAVPPDYATDIDHFATRLRADAQGHLGRGETTPFQDFAATAAVPDIAQGSGGKKLLSQAAIDTGDAVRVGQPLYVDGDVRVGAGSEFLRVYAAGNLQLGATSTVSDWAHADGHLRAAAGCTLRGRASAGRAMQLGESCTFERVQAPHLHFGGTVPRAVAQAASPQETGLLEELPRAQRQSDVLVRVQGDCELPPHRLYRGCLVVTGMLRIGESTTVVGDVKARAGVTLAPGAVVQGAVISEARISLCPGARAFGPVVCEGDILLGAATVVGLPAAPTTVSADNIVVGEGAVVHGAAWAHDIGVVMAQDPPAPAPDTRRHPREL